MVVTSLGIVHNDYDVGMMLMARVDVVNNIIYAMSKNDFSIIYKGHYQPTLPNHLLSDTDGGAPC